MIQFSIDSLKNGMKVGKNILDSEGKLLLGRGVIINDFIVNRLKKRGVTRLFVKDDSTDDIELQESISEMVRGATIKHMKGLFEDLNDITKEMKDQSYIAVIDAVSSDQFKNTFRNNPAITKITSDAGNIVEELLSGDVTLGLNSIKTFDSYTFQHSIDVAIVSIMIGRKIGLDTKRLRELGVGCLLHDIGKTFIPEEIVNKPGKLTDEEYETMKAHPLIGYELTKDTPEIGVLPPHIALQHHEKQDGTGYPRGLKGDNKLNIPKESQRIHLYGHIVAVADIYDALSSDRPYREAFPPEKVIKIMREMSGTHLNRVALRYFLSIAPVYPVGSTIRILNGNYRNHFGIVCSLNDDKLDRPVVRVVYNSVKKKVPPVDINLAAEEDVLIETILF